MMRFVRFMMLLAGSLFLLAVFRAIMGAFKAGLAESGITGGGGAAPGTSPKQGPQPARAGGELKKCAACGTYNTIQNCVTKFHGVETTYFCSNECKARHAA